MPASTKPAETYTPALRVTRYEQVSAFLIAIVAGLVVIVALLSMLWYSTRVTKPQEPIPVELIENTGGSEDGAIGETLRVDSPLEANPDAGSAEIASEQPETPDSIDQVLATADEAVTRVEPRPFELGSPNQGKPGSAQGTGRRPLGSGPGTGGGFSREQRWLVRFADQADLDEYTRQLDYFGIEFGAIVNGQLVYLSKLSSARPAVRKANSGADEKRLYMTWQGGGRKQADLQIFRKAGIDVGNGVIFHFYPKETEDRLAQLERAYRNRVANDIRRTYFSVERAKSGYEFTVSHQTYLK